MIIFISGGADSGKSHNAEKLSLIAGGRKLYIAAMENKSENAKVRISAHRKMREGKGFDTLERLRNITKEDVINYDTVLLECLGNLTANHMFGGGSKEELYNDVDCLINNCKNLIFVSNDISSELMDKYSSDVIDYVKLLNSVSCYIVKKAHIVIESVNTNMNIIKGKKIYEESFGQYIN